MLRKLTHYLRPARRRLDLTQADVAALMGDKTAAKISRYERGERLPPLQTALAYEAITRKPVSDLFGGLFDQIRRTVARRAAKRMQVEVRGSHSALAHRKESLESIASQ
jgi:transcriptional regulator with XRE-family HTH domain